MRIDSITLCWFRGAADHIALDCGLKSLVVYGQNGAGKSSFVDAVEYALNGGKIAHLAHEYSGTRQEKAVPNTHTPQECNSSLSIKLKDGIECNYVIAKNGTHTKSGAGDLAAWDYRRTVLRQDEIARFIHSSKGAKYSDLLPLLGLGDLEIAADNLRQLNKAVEQHSRLKEMHGAASEIAQKHKQSFGDASVADIETKAAALHKKYCATSTTKDAVIQCDETLAQLMSRIEVLSSEEIRYLTLRELSDVKLAPAVKNVRDANGKLTDSVEPLVREKLQVLEAAQAYGVKLNDDAKIPCPACGQSVGKDDFKSHVKTEQERLKEIGSVFKSRRVAISSLIDILRSIKTSAAKKEHSDWIAEQKVGQLNVQLDWLSGLDVEAFRQTANETELVAIEQHCPPIVAAANSAAQTAPPAIQELSEDKALVDAAKSAIEAKTLIAKIARAEKLVEFIGAAEDNVRKEIRDKSKAAIDDISSDIGNMWKVLHPDEPIEEVRLYLPDDDKAIDIALKFHGKDQESPRLTLSEGYRNSLGLCIFLALAKCEAGSDRPLILDDIVVSFDRDHRGMIVELLHKEFSGRQVIIFTHDRDWYADLRYQLASKEWQFRSLLPFETPKIGIRWSGKTTTFDDARAHLQERPDSAGNDARKIMDVELSIIADKIRLRLPYLRGDKNDHRMCGEFLKRLISDGKKCFQKKNSTEYPVFADALALLDTASKLLVSWGNRSSHSQDVTRSEATMLIDACEKALDVFKCSSCSRPVTFTEASSQEWVQCQCGELRWRYGKG